MNKRITLKSLAEITGFSVTTVSRALSGYDDVSPTTRETILSAAEELGYYPNLTARQLQKQRTDTVGLILPSKGSRLADPYFSMILAGIGDSLADSGIDLLISTRYQGKDELEVYRRMVEGRRVDGLIVIRTRCEDQRIAYLAEKEFPFVAFGRTKLAVDYSYIDEDGEAGVYELVSYLIGLGHQRIAYISAPRDLMFAHYRLEGYSRSLEDASISVDEALIIEGDLTRRTGMMATESLLSLESSPTAIVAANDLMALGAISIAQERGMAIGRDLSVAGFDDVPAAENLSLTTLRQPIYEIGGQLSQLLHAMINGNQVGRRQILLKPKLILRSSTGKPASVPTNKEPKDQLH
jgi:LacI family transcriptional regulator